MHVYAKHDTTGTDEYSGTVSNATSNSATVVIEDQSADPVVNLWTGNGPKSVSGNESFKVRLVFGGQEIKPGYPIKVGNEYYQVTYSEKPTKTFDEDNKKTTITDHVQLSKMATGSDYHYSSILGDGLYYGITANVFEQRNHIQSNFAVNKYDGQNNVVEADLAANSGTIIYAESTNGKINIGTGAIPEMCF